MVSEKSSVFSEKLSAGANALTSIALEMRDSIIALAGDRSAFDNRETWLRRAAHAAGVPYRTAKSLFYCECSDPKSSVVEQVRAAAIRKKIRDGAARYDAITDASQSEFAEFNARLKRVEAILIRGPDIGGAKANEIRRVLGGDNRPMDSREEG